MLDLLLRGGTVVDGTGAARRVADVGVRDGRVVSLGETDEPARRVDDVTGLVVAPGFVDIHTHYDAQLFWDPTASPSPLHGVTTVFGGNCGFGLAPLAPTDDGYLMRMMAKVEGMPLAALDAGLDWDWTTFPEWLDRIDRPLGVNAGFLCGHSALRHAVMGDAAVHGAADADQVDAMVHMLRDAVAAGAMGFSTSTAPPHHDGDGHPVPSRFAARDEMIALAGALRDHPGTTLELILAGSLSEFSDDETDLMTSMSLAADRSINWNVLGLSATNRDHAFRQLRASDHAAARGARVVALTLPHGTRIRLSFLAGAPLDGLPGWREVFALPVGERVRALADPDVRERLAQGATSDEAGVLRGLANWPIMQIVEAFTPDTRALVGRSVGDIAREQHKDPFDALLDIVVADELRTGFRPPQAPENDADLAFRSEMWRDPRVIIGGSDAGAHVDMMCGAVYSTSVLAGVRRGGLALEEAVHLLSDVPARFYGLRDRGRVALGHHADLVVFDPDTVDYGTESTRFDLPGGAWRLTTDSVGIDRVYVNGTPVVASGALTGATPGGLLRSGRDTDTVRASSGASRG